MFDLDWLQRPAGHGWVAAVTLLLLGGALFVYLPSLRRLITRGVDPRCAASVEPALLLLVALVVPPVVSLTRFGFFVSEPRYALPLYAVVPLLVGALWRAPLRVARPGIVRWGVVVGVLGLNLWSLVSSDPRLWRPEESPDSTAATRAELVAYLVAEDRHQMYADYWIAYPIMFEAREAVLAYVISGGFNRYVPPADNVQRTPNPAWVFTPGMEAERVFLADLATVGGTAQVADVSVYRVYKNVEPLEALRPPR
jgi:hypothetical protein